MDPVFVNQPRGIVNQLLRLCKYSVQNAAGTGLRSLALHLFFQSFMFALHAGTTLMDNGERG